MKGGLWQQRWRITPRPHHRKDQNQVGILNGRHACRYGARKGAIRRFGKTSERFEVSRATGNTLGEGDFEEPSTLADFFNQGTDNFLDCVAHHGLEMLTVASNLLVRMYIEHAASYINDELVPQFGNGFTILHFATVMCDAELVESLLKIGADPNKANVENITPLALGIEDENLDNVEALLEGGADPNYAIREGITPLVLVVKYGSIEVANLLLKYGANPHLLIVGGMTPLVLAVVEGHVEMVDAIMSSTLTNELFGSDQEIVAGVPKIGKAVGEAEEVPLGVERMNMKDLTSTLLLHAAETGEMEVAKVLLKYGADPNVVIEDWTPLMVAAYRGFTDMVNLLLARGASLEGHPHSSAICYAAVHGHVEAMEAILKSMEPEDCDMNANVMWALYQAAKQGHANVLEVLLDLKVNTDFVVGGVTPLGQAAREGHVEAVQVLLRNGAESNEPLDDVHPLFMASHNGHAQVVEAMLDSGVDANAVFEGVSCLYAAVQRGHEDVEKLLLRYGARSAGGSGFLTPSSSVHKAWVQDHGKIEKRQFNIDALDMD